MGKKLAKTQPRQVQRRQGQGRGDEGKALFQINVRKMRWTRIEGIDEILELPVEEVHQALLGRVRRRRLLGNGKKK